MKLAVWLLVAHALAVSFSLVGMLIALPNPELWASSAAQSGTRDGLRRKVSDRPPDAGWCVAARQNPLIPRNPPLIPR